jgi:hypothetical protein
MSGIHDAILQHLQEALEAALITDVAEDDLARANKVQIGPLQDDPERILVTVHENDPDRIAKGSVTGMTGEWGDEVYSVEIGRVITFVRRFTVKARCLFEITGESLDTARSIASTVRERIEVALLQLSFSNVQSGSEYVSRGIMADDILGEMLQAGGPPDAYDYHIKIRVSLLTTRTGVTV